MHFINMAYGTTFAYNWKLLLLIMHKWCTDDITLYNDILVLLGKTVINITSSELGSVTNENSGDFTFDNCFT